MQRDEKFKVQNKNSFVCLLYINLSNKDIEPDNGKKKETSEHVNRINSINLFANVVKEVIPSSMIVRVTG